MNLYKKSYLLAAASMLLGVLPATAATKSPVTYEQRAESQKTGRCFDLKKDADVEQKISKYLSELADDFLKNTEELKKDAYFYLLKDETHSFDVQVTMKKADAGCDVQIICFGTEKAAQKEVVGLLDRALKAATDKKTTISTGKVIGGIGVVSVLALAAVFSTKMLRRSDSEVPKGSQDPQEDTSRLDYASPEELNALKAEIERALALIPGVTKHVEVLLWGPTNHKTVDGVNQFGKKYTERVYSGPHAVNTPENNKKVKIILCPKTLHDCHITPHRLDFGPLTLVYVGKQLVGEKDTWEIDIRGNSSSWKKLESDNSSLVRQLSSYAPCGEPVSRADIPKNLAQFVRLLSNHFRVNKTS